VAVGDHAAVAIDGDRGGDGRVPAREPSGTGQVDALLVLKGPPAVVTVDVVTEAGGEAGSQAKTGTRDREVRDATGRRSHAGRPHLGAGLRRGGEPGEDDVEEDHPRHEDVDVWTVGGAQAGEGIPAACCMR